MLQGKELHHIIFTEYLEKYCGIVKGFSPKTIRDKREIFLRLLKFLGEKELDAKEFSAFRDSLYATWKTSQSRLDLTNILRAFINWLAKKGYIEKSYAEELEKPKVSKRVKFDYVEPKIVDEIIIAGTEPKPFVFGLAGDNSKNRYIKSETRLALRFILRTGLRISELIHLSGSDLHIYDGSFEVLSKGAIDGEKDLLPLPKDMIEELKKRVDRERIFEVTDETCNAALKRGIEKLGMKVKITNHSLRHIFATSLKKQGVDSHEIQRLLRHDDIRTTVEYYMHLDIRDLSRIINNQPNVSSGLAITEKINLVEQAIKNTGIQDDKRLSIFMEHLDNGGFIFRVLPIDANTFHNV